MTDPAAPGVEHDLDRLNQDKHFADCLATAAQACYTNFRWLEDNDFKHHITLLDFDVICGALPTLALYRARAEAAEQWHREEAASREAGAPGPPAGAAPPSEVSLEKLVGPHKVKFHLQNMRRFTLPHGTVAELVNWKEKLTKRISEQARHFIGRMEQAASAPDPVAAILSTGGETGRVSDIFRREAALLESDIQRMEMVGQILDRQTPIEELLAAGSGERRSGEAFRKVHNYLQARRPRRSMNNFNDAVNVTLLVRLFNAAERMRFMPVLVSGTYLLTDYSKELGAQRLPRHQEPPGFIQNEMYLTVAHSLLRFAENRYPNVINMALVLRQHAEELALSYRALLRQINNGGGVQLEWKRMQQKQRTFLNEWLPIFTEAFDSDKLDSVLFSNQIITEEISLKLDREWDDESRREVRRVRDAFVEHLEKYKTPIFDSLEIQLLPSAGGGAGRAEPEEQRHKLEVLFDISVVENDGRPLRDVLVGSPVSTLTSIEEADDHRFVLHPRSVPVGALLSIDSWKERETGARRLEVVWPHKASVLRIWSHAVRLLCACVGRQASRTTAFLYRISALEPRRGEATLDEVRGVMGKVLKQSRERPELPAYFELQAGSFTFFADIEPLEGKELQAGLMMDYAGLEPAVPDAVAEALAKTSAVPTSTAQYREILRYVFTKIGVLPNPLGAV